VNRERRAQVLDEDTRAYLKALAEQAPPLSDEARAMIRAAFHGAIARPKPSP
jgi:hypothetical protein